MSKAQNKYQEYRNKLLADDPHCYRCGIEHGHGQQALQYHHVIPQQTGITDHAQGYLLCRPCHALEHAIERRIHKAVDQHGYTNGAFVGQPRRKQERRKARAVRLTEAWT